MRRNPGVLYSSPRTSPVRTCINRSNRVLGAGRLNFVGMFVGKLIAIRLPQFLFDIAVVLGYPLQVVAVILGDLMPDARISSIS